MVHLASFAFFGLAAAAAIDSQAAVKDLSSSIQDLAKSFANAETEAVVSALKNLGAQFDNSYGGSSHGGGWHGGNSSQQACAISKCLFPDGYVDRNNGNYTAAEEVNWSETCWLPAACYVSPANTFEVSTLVKVLTRTGSKFAVRSAGHNPNALFASIDSSGVLIDVSKLKTLTVSGDNSVIQAGTGNQWGDVYKLADSKGLFAIGGREVTVGVSGLSLGCGIPIIPSLAGLACDNVKNFEIVLGDSSIVNANATSNPDLFKSLKGGGNNYGIVTRLDVATVPFHELWYESIAFTQNQYKDVLPAIVQTQKNMEKDDKSGIIIQCGFGAIKITYLYAKHVTSVPAVFAPLDKINHTTTVPATNGTPLQFSNSVSPPSPPGFRSSAGVSSLVDTKLYTDVYEEFITKQNFSSNPVTAMVMVIQQFGAAATKAGIARGGNSLGLTPVPQNWWSLEVQWTVPSDQQIARTTLLNMKDFIVQKATQARLSLPFIFANTADYTQNVIRSYGSDNVQRMKAASAKYDPRQVFQKQLSGAWFVSRA